MFEFEDKKKIIIPIVIVALIIIVCVIFCIKNNKEDYLEIDNFLEDNFTNEEIINVQEEKNKIIIHISGEVVNEGVIEINEGSRIIDAIEEAGGLTNDADLKRVNLAYMLEDGQKVHIPNVNDVDVSVVTSSIDKDVVLSGSGDDNKEDKIMIDINSANIEELQKLSGIGEAMALRIIEYRKENGKFTCIEDIKNISGIGDSKFNKIKNNIYVK